MSKPAIITWIELNHETVECNFYATMGQTAYAAAIASAFSAQWYATGGFALVGGAAELTYNLSGCNTPPPPPDESGGPSTGNCWKVANGVPAYIRNLSNPESVIPAYSGPVKQILEVVPGQLSPSAPPGSTSFATLLLPDDSVVSASSGAWSYDTASWFLESTESDPCIGTDEGPTHLPGEPIADPFTHTEDGCEWTIQATDAYVDTAGRLHTYYTITADNEACGGPFAYWSSEDGPGFVPVIDPDGGPNPPPGADCCNEIREKLDEIADCACGDTPPVLEGEFRTISFRSDETSPYGKSRLRKRFRYRSVSGYGLSEVVDHWRDFNYEAGPVCVIHSGGSWGTPQVWAATADEGKRVIRHAAAEAGFDPDTTGKWTITGSSSARVGVGGTMRVDTKGGYYWITSRDGSNQRPTVALT